MGEQRLTEAGDQRPVGQLAHVGQARRETAVDEHQAVRWPVQRRQRPGIHQRVGGRLESEGLQRAQVGQAPGFLLAGGPAQRLETVERFPAQAGDSVRLAAVRHEVGEGRAVGVGEQRRGSGHGWSLTRRPGARGPAPRCTARNPAPPVPAPVPCRRNERCGH